MELNQRKRDILSAIIHTYIITGEPVGSKLLCDSQGLNLSSATIRAQMGELCEMGLLEQPHTSAGRVPTAKGFRFYVNELMNRYTLTDEDKQMIDSMLPREINSPERLMEAACESLAELTNCAAMLTTPADREAYIGKIQLIPIGRRTVMTVLITSTGIIKNRVARCEYDVTDELLEKVSAILREKAYSLTLEDFGTPQAQGILTGLGLDALNAAPILAAVVDAVGDAIECELKMKGESNLLLHRDFSPHQARNLMNWLRNRSTLLGMMNRQTDDLTVLFGDETHESALNNSGVVITRYKIGSKSMGTLGILGPDRMDYEHLIPSLLYFRDSLGRLLTNSFSEDI